MTRRLLVLITLCLLPLALACSGDEAENAADSAAAQASDAMDQATNAASDAMDQAGAAAAGVADQAGAAVNDAAAGLAGNAVAACRQFAEQQAWGQALEVCRKAHEMMPDDLALEHAYQQAQAAAGN